MDKTLLLRYLAFMALAFMVGYTAHAQQPQSPSVAYQVTGLTASGRDAISQQLALHGDLRLAFACVPAGILVFEPVNGILRSDLRQQLEGLMAQQVGRSALVETTLDRTQLEAQCAATRDL